MFSFEEPEQLDTTLRYTKIIRQSLFCSIIHQCTGGRAYFNDKEFTRTRISNWLTQYEILGAFLFPSTRWVQFQIINNFICRNFNVRNGIFETFKLSIFDPLGKNYRLLIDQCDTLDIVAKTGIDNLSHAYNIQLRVQIDWPFWVKTTE